VFEQQIFSYTAYEKESHIAEQEVWTLMHTVSRLLGAKNARRAGGPWLEEADLVDSPPVSTSRTWRSVTVAASALFFNTINAGQSGSVGSTVDADVLDMDQRE